MGFQLSEKNINSCILVSTLEGENKAGLLSCIQQALASSKLEICIDLTLTPGILLEITPELISLQKVLQKHSQNLQILGVDPTSERGAAENLQVIGITFAHCVNSSPADAVKERVLTTKLGLGESLRQKRLLEEEKSFYEERLKVLERGHEQGSLSEKGLAENSLLEKDNQRLKELMIIAEQGAREAEVLFKKTLHESEDEKARLVEESKKMREPVEKQLVELKTSQEKAKQEFQRKSESRKAQLAKLSSNSK